MNIRRAFNKLHFLQILSKDVTGTFQYLVLLALNEGTIGPSRDSYKRLIPHYRLSINGTREQS